MSDIVLSIFSIFLNLNKFKFNYPTYSISLASDMVFNNLSVAYKTQDSSHHMPFLQPLFHLSLTITLRKSLNVFCSLGNKGLG